MARLEALIAEGIADVEAGRVYEADKLFDEIEFAIREVELEKTA